MAISLPKAMQVSTETQPLKKKYRAGGKEYKVQKSKIRTNASQPTKKGEHWRSVKAVTRRGLGAMPEHIKYH